MEVNKNYAGRLSKHLLNWKQITKNNVILDWIQGYNIKFISNPIQKHKPQVFVSKKEFNLYDTLVNDLQNINAISTCDHVQNEFLSPYFLVKKSNGSYRFILNLKKLNKFIEAPHFKLEDFRTAKNLITRDCFMASIDLKDAYFLISVKKECRKYLRFEFNNKLYEFNCLPFGLNVAPFIWMTFF